MSAETTKDYVRALLSSREQWVLEMEHRIYDFGTSCPNGPDCPICRARAYEGSCTEECLVCHELYPPDRVDGRICLGCVGELKGLGFRRKEEAPE